MKKIALLILAMTFISLSLQAQTEKTYTEMFDSVFSDCLNQNFQD